MKSSKPEDVNMWPAGFRSTGILTNSISPKTSLPGTGVNAKYAIEHDGWCQINIFNKLPGNDKGEPAVSYRFTGWAWEISGRSSTLQEITDHFRRIFRIYPIYWTKTRGCRHVTGRTCKHEDLNQLWCPKISPTTSVYVWQSFCFSLLTCKNLHKR